ncbi:fatty acid synthase subunit beta domain-containing protein [Corynebacterium sphenisci]|uniref:fatty acid synthase subunit beta domain-containing protein n=1 Tax=Corynebacterium sphenisci TaxID=191493 RepID=UPI000AFE6FFD
MTVTPTRDSRTPAAAPPITHAAPAAGAAAPAGAAMEWAAAAAAGPAAGAVRATLGSRLAAGEGFALSFSGQGGPWLDTLATCAAAGVDGRLAAALAEAEAMLAPLAEDLAGQRPAGFDPLGWARALAAARTAGVDDSVADLAGAAGGEAAAAGPAAIPGVPAPDRLADPAVSTPGILAAQVAMLDLLAAQGVDPAAAEARIGHSQGVLGVAAAESPERLAEILALAQILGVEVARRARLADLGAAGGRTPMLAVRGARPDQVRPHLAGAAVLGLVNSHERVVVVGPPADLAATRAGLEEAAARDAAEIEAKRRGGRGLAPVLEWLPVQAGYHHPGMAGAVARTVERAAVAGIDAGLAGELARRVLVDPVDWPAEVDAVEAGWILELGPGAGVAALTRELVAGRGIGVIAAATPAGQAALFEPGSAPERPGPWSAHAPRLVRRGGRVRVETAFTRVTGRPPVLLGGMTPTTVDPGIVAAAANAGYWAELAGGGQVTPEIFDANVTRLGELLHPGRAAQFNTMFLDPYLWGLHIGGHRLVQRAVAAGAPLDGVTVSAGIPEREEAIALVAQLHAAGIPHISFKPGTLAQIDAVLDIAAGTAATIIMQVEGGRAGGHHSWEELDDLLLARYPRIRERDNVVLAVGGGIGTPERGAEYLTGAWARAHGRPAMPVDAVIIGTAAMAARESTASPGVKRMLVETAGVDGWVPAGGAAGGMASGRSQLGADIHEIDNAAARAGRLLDEVAGDAAAVAARRAEIIAAIDATAKPFFGDLAEMSYAEVLRRFLELAAPGGRWLDRGLRERFGMLLDRTESRLAAVDSGEFDSVRPASDADPAAEPDATAEAAGIGALAGAYDLDQRLHPADVGFFLRLCRLPGKPVPFVPVIDEEVRRWWRSDSLWQAHDGRYPAEGVCIIPGTTAVAGITRADEPVAEILGRFEDAAAAALADAGAAEHPGEEDPVAAVLAAPVVTWAGRQQPNPVHRVAAPGRWEPDHDGAVHRASGASLRPAGARAAELRLPLAGVGDPGAALSVRITAPAGPGAQPVVETADAVAAMTGLTRIAAGGELPEVTAGGVAEWTAPLDGTYLADHAAVTAADPHEAGSAAPAPDALVGPAWPAVFAVLAAARTAAGEPVVEGMLSLVHLGHRVRPAGPDAAGRLAAAAATGARLRSRARATGIEDTDIGRVVEVVAELAAVDGAGAETPLATLTERFAIRGRVGAGVARTGGGVPAERVDTPRAGRGTATVAAPASMAAFAAVTGDRNPIHVDPHAARLAGLAGPIAHGMWLSAVAQRVAAGADGTGALLDFTATMLAPVAPGAEVRLTAVRRGVGAGAGEGEIRQVTATVDGEPVLTAEALLAAPPTCYAFPGQGIQATGMGLAARADSAAAREVWAAADRHTREKLGFSVLAIVRDNPAEVLVRGRRFHHPEGVLNLTQFTQVAMATLGLAQAAQLREAGVLDETAVYAGHSVGEYNALAALAGVLGAGEVLEVVYHRGLTMHSLVPRDAAGRSDYGLAALRPDRAGIAEDGVIDAVARVAAESGEFLEVVNHNLAGRQYAVAGTVAGLAALAAAVGEDALLRIPGIDVPFHSSVLRPGVAGFREHLERLLPAEVDPAALVGRYIPNLVARPFALDRDFVAAIADTVDSAVARGILDDFEAHAKRPAALARTLLVELLAWQFCSPVRWIETQDLLFGELGVRRFIEVGVGSAPTLANLAARTAALRGSAYPATPEVLNVERDAAAVLARDEDPADADPGAAAGEPEPGPAAGPEPAGRAEPGTAAEAVDRARPAPAPAAAEPGSGERPADLRLTPADATTVLIALWTKVRPEQMGAADSIETLVDGVSSRRNQLLLDLGTEFGLGAIDGAADAALPELAGKLEGLARGWSPWGPVLDEALADGLRRLTGPAGARPGHVAERVRGHWALGEGWAAAVVAELVLGCREGDSVRGGALGHLSPGAPADAADLDRLIDAAVAAVAAARGIAVAPPAAEAAAGVVDAAALGDFAERVTGEAGVLAVAARTILAELGHQPTGAVDFAAEDADERLVDLVAAELGPDWPRLVAPAFEAERAVLIDDRWASAREDLARMWAGGPAPRAVPGAAAAQAAWWADRAEAAGRAGLAAAYRDLAGAAEQGGGRFAGDVAVVTGASPDSIAAEVLAGLLAGGATVVATTSRLTPGRLGFYKRLYREHAAGGAALWVVPANLGSYADLDALIDWIGAPWEVAAGGGTELRKPALRPTLLFPFAAPPVAGTAAEAGPAAETQARLLLWGVERLLTGLAAIDADAGVDHRMHVVLPGSPNRGRFGGDGAYGEAKAALDALVARWSAEAWGRRVTLVHALIGWVRGTGLMAGNDPLVGLVEERGVRTFDTAEMAAALLDHADAGTRERARRAPVTVDLTGGLGDADLVLGELAAEAAARAAEDAPGAGAAGRDEGERPRRLAALPAPRRPLDWTEVDFGGVRLDPEEMTVIVGAGELGPWGSSRTRFEAEIGDVSAAGILELAWSMGLITWEDGWVGADGAELDEASAAEALREEVLARVGVRHYGDDGDLVDNTRTELTTVYLDRELSFPVRDRATARTFVDSDPEHTTARPGADGEWLVTRAAGTAVQVPRRMAMSRFVGGQIPEGFDPAVYGIPADLRDNLDRVSLWNLVTTVEAFLASGFTPAELLAHVHPGRVSSTQGTGIGAMESLRSLYIDGILGAPRANDVLQEALPNVIAAHVMQSYVGGYGQMTHPVAACATAAVSVEEAVDKLRLGKADFVVAGGFDDLSVEGITGFGDMAATADSAAMAAKGIDPARFSRPNDRRRGGFVESQGGGTLLLARGSVARDLGLPVLGVVAHAASYADGAHVSIPAPGLGALGAGRGGAGSPLARDLAAHGIDPEEVAVVSKHDTSTAANDPNESELHERLADALGRDPANPLFVVSQKSLTGHAKGGAAAFQMIGLTQVLRTGVVPGNRSLDCVDPVLARHPRLVWPTEALALTGAVAPKAGLVTSLGFGHVSALVAIAHPGCFAAAVARADGPAAAADWARRARAREAAGLRRIEEAMHGGPALYERPRERRLAVLGGYPDTAAVEQAVLLDPDARLVGGLLTPGAAR